MKQWIFWILLSLFILLQGVITTIPLVLLLLLVLYIRTKKEFVIIGAFLSGTVLDIMRIQNHLGATSFFLITVLALVMLYEKKYEIDTIQFTIVSSCLAVISLLLFMQETFNIFFILTSCIIALIIFVFAKLLIPKEQDKLRVY